MKFRPTIIREAPVPADLTFWFWGRPLRVVRSIGDDAAAPVIVEELAESQHALPGQYSLWSLDGVRRVLARNSSASRRRAAE